MASLPFGLISSSQTSSILLLARTNTPSKEKISAGRESVILAPEFAGSLQSEKCPPRAELCVHFVGEIRCRDIFTHTIRWSRSAAKDSFPHQPKNGSAVLSDNL